MRLLLTLVLISVFLACQQKAVFTAYEPFHKTIEIKELGNQDELIQKLYLDYESNPITQAQKDQNLIIDYLTEHKISATQLPSGLYYKVYKYGTGSMYHFGKQFSAIYTGYFLDGQVFDSNLNAGKPLKMNVGEMIQGWNEGMTNVSRGSKASFYIPSHLAYEVKGVKGVIPPNSVLIFDVDLAL